MSDYEREAARLSRTLFRYEELGKPGPFPVFLSPLEFWERMTKALRAAASDERERCARECDRLRLFWEKKYDHSGVKAWKSRAAGAGLCAETIRALGGEVEDE